MKFRCIHCKKSLSKSIENSVNGDMLVSPWYKDETGTNHIAILCLHCKTLHDTKPSILKAVFSFSRSPLSVDGYFTQSDLSKLIQKASEASGENDKYTIATNELRLPPKIVQRII